MSWLLLGLSSSDSTTKDICMLNHYLRQKPGAPQVQPAHTPHVHYLASNYVGKRKEGIGAGGWLIIFGLLYWGYAHFFAAEVTTPSKPIVNSSSITTPPHNKYY